MAMNDMMPAITITMISSIIVNPPQRIGRKVRRGLMDAVRLAGEAMPVALSMQRAA
jgi:hypothetical protein